MSAPAPRRRAQFAALAATTALVLAACGGNESDSAAQTPSASGEAASGVLAGVCPANLVFQLDWEPEAEHGGIYQMVGEGYTVDTDKKAVRGPLVSKGEDTGVDIEIRIGGAPVGYQQPQALMYQDKEIFAGFARVGETISALKEQPITSVFSTFEKSAYAIYWDPATYPNAKTIADLKKDNVTILMGGDASTWLDYLAGEGIVDRSQMDLSDQAKPAAFITARGKVAEAGFATAEPYLYEVELKDQWGKPLTIQLIHDTGYEEYFQSVAVRNETLTSEADCLAELVPILQQAQVDYLTDPEATNALIVQLVETYDDGWVYTAGAAAYAHDKGLELGIMGNGSTPAMGDYDTARVEKLIELVGKYSDADTTGVTADDLVTNEFIDPSITLPSS